MDNGLDKDVDSAMKQLLAATKKANELRAQSVFFWMYELSSAADASPTV
jgi:hypothetical protein